jgi:cytoplasmic iron level regulating protein YaaA (DUF328/UPF0246 family)
MLIVLSPAKSLTFEKQNKVEKYTIPRYLGHSQKLIDVLKTFPAEKISKLMSISSKLADLNVERYALWMKSHTVSNSKQAVLAFDGDVYDGLNALSFSNDDFDFLQSKVRILSGLYGVLLPLDIIQPYRLEMGTKLVNSSGKNLYDFWTETVTKSVINDLKNESVLVNLASKEYFKVVDIKKINNKIITPVFKEEKKNKFEIVSFYAKKARGLMTKFIVENKIENVEDIKAFDSEKYSFNPRLSNEIEFVFTR